MGVGYAFEAAGQSRLLGDWVTEQTDVSEDWWQDARTLAARHWHAYQNDPHARALADCLVTGVFGSEGLRWRSQYQADGEDATSAAERDARRQIDQAMAKHFTGRRLDITGHLTHRELGIALYLSKIMAGDGYAIWNWRPSRPWAPRGTCWRLIDPSRVSNPYGKPNSPTLFEGHQLDADTGATMGIWVQSRRTRFLIGGADLSWVYVPMYHPAGGFRQVIHTARRKRPEQIRGFGIMSAALMSLRQLSETTKAWVIAKRMQASMGLIISCDDPEAMRRGDRNGALINSNTAIRPGIKWYVRTGTKVEPLNFNFQGSDYEAFRNPVLEAICASAGIPYQYALMQLTKSNMAASRVALGQAYATFRSEQAEHIDQVETDLVASCLYEEIERGELDVATADRDLLARGRWSRPPRLVPDPLKEAQAASAWIDLGDSFTDTFAEAGKDFEPRVSQRAEDQAFLAAQGVQPHTVAAPPAAAEPPPADAPPADPAAPPAA